MRGARHMTDSPETTPESAMTQRVKFYQTGTHTVGNRLMDEAKRTVQASIDRSTTPSPPATAPVRAAARRWARATRSTRRCARRTGSWSPSTPPAAWKCLPRPIRKPPGRCLGCIRCSATPRRSPRASPPPMRRKGRGRCARHRAGRGWRHDRYRVRLPLRHVRAQR